MADQNSPWGTVSAADSAVQSADAWGIPTTVLTDGGGTGWLTSTPVPNVEHFNILDPLHKTLVPLDNWVAEGIDWVVTHFHPVFQGVRVLVDHILSGFQQLLSGIPTPVTIIVFTLIAWQISGVGMGVATLVSLIAIGAIGAWSQAVVTLALVLTALLFCTVIGLPLGIWPAGSPQAAKIIRPLLDAIQTILAFVYLAPIAILFDTGNASGVVVAIILALPLIIRLTTLGINQVPADLIGTSRSFGTSPHQMLFKVQLPLTMPTIMVNVGRMLMLALPMVITALMITTDGLGQMVPRDIGRLDMGPATVGGVGIVILAIILDRLMQAAGCDLRSRGNRRWYTTGPAGLLTRLSIKQLCACPVTLGIITLPKKGITMRHSILFATAFTMLISTRTFAADLPGEGITVNPTQSTVIEETFQTLLVSRALEELGCIVNRPSEVGYNIGYTLLASGDATFTAVNWTPLYDNMYGTVGGNKKFYRERVSVNGMAQGYLISKKIVNQYKIINTVQLKDPKIAKLFNTNGDGKMDLTGCNPGWGCEGAINHQPAAYELAGTATHNQGNYAAMIADTIGRYKEGKPVFYYTWMPYWVGNELKPGKDIVWLQAPSSALPGDKNANTKLSDSTNYGFPVSIIHIVVSKAWAEKNPAAARLSVIMQLPMADINAQNAIMHSGEASEGSIQGHVDGWIKAHQQQFDGWVSKTLVAQR